MAGSTPLLAVQYPLGSEVPAGNEQMETIARALEKYAVLPVANEAARDTLITAALRHDGTIAWLTTPDELQVWDGSGWRTIFKVGDAPLRRGTDLPAAANFPNGGVFSRTTDNSVWLNIGSGWIRLLDSQDVNSATSNFSGDTVTTSHVAGTDDPNGGAKVSTDVRVPESGRLQVTVSAQMKCSTNDDPVYFGFEVRAASGGNTWVQFNKGRAARVTRDSLFGSSWTSIVQTGHAGDNARVFGMHAVSDNSKTGTFNSREVAAIPVR